MGQKVNPIGFRVGVNRAWRSMWYASKKDFPVYLYEDAMIRKFIKKKLEGAAVSKVTIERAANRVRCQHTHRSVPASSSAARRRNSISSRTISAPSRPRIARSSST